MSGTAGAGASGAAGASGTAGASRAAAASGVRTWDEGPVRVIAIDRPDRRNALAPATAEALRAALAGAESDPAVGAAVLTGIDGHFSAGGDLASILEVTGDDAAALALMRVFHGLVEQIWDSGLPVIAALSGVVYGGAVNLALACDLAVCSADARFCQVFLRRGLVPDLGGAYLLPRLVGMRRAKELMLLAPEIDAAQALELGLVNAVYDDAEDALAQAVALGRRLADGPRVAISLTKRLMNASSGGSLRDALALEAVSQTVALRGQDAREGLAALRPGAARRA